MKKSPVHYRFSVILFTLFAIGLPALHADSNNYPDAVNALNPVIYYRLNGNLNNSATGSKAITDPLEPGSWSPSYASGPAGSSYQGFQDSNQGVNGIPGGSSSRLRLASATAAANLNSALNGSGGLTFSVWFNLSALPSANYTLMAGTINSTGTTGFQMSISTTGFTLLGRSTETDTQAQINRNYTLQTGTWYNLVGVMDFANDTIALYLDGSLLGSVTSVTTWSSDTFANGGAGNTGSFALGSARTGSDALTNGILDEATIFNQALSGTQVASLYNAALVPEPSSMAFCAFGLAALCAWKGLLKKRN